MTSRCAPGQATWPSTRCSSVSHDAATVGSWVARTTVAPRSASARSAASTTRAVLSSSSAVGSRPRLGVPAQWIPDAVSQAGHDRDRPDRRQWAPATIAAVKAIGIPAARTAITASIGPVRSRPTVCSRALLRTAWIATATPMTSIRAPVARSVPAGGTEGRAVPAAEGVDRARGAQAGQEGEPGEDGVPARTWRTRSGGAAWAHGSRGCTGCSRSATTRPLRRSD